MKGMGSDVPRKVLTLVKDNEEATILTAAFEAVTDANIDPKFVYSDSEFAREYRLNGWHTVLMIEDPKKDRLASLDLGYYGEPHHKRVVYLKRGGNVAEKPYLRGKSNVYEIRLDESNLPAIQPSALLKAFELKKPPSHPGVIF